MMDFNASTTNRGNQNNGIVITSPGVALSPRRQESLSDSRMDKSESSEPDIEAMRQRIHEMEEEAEKLKQMQFDVEKQIQTPTTAGTCVEFES